MPISKTTSFFAVLSILYLVCAPLVVQAEESIGPNDISGSSTQNTEILPESLANLSITGSLEAAFERNDSTGVWSVHASGSYEGILGNATIADTFIYGADDTGKILATWYLGKIPQNPSISSPFQINLVIPPPDLSWKQIGFGIHVTDESGKSANIRSDLFPIIWRNPVVLDHAIGGRIIDPPNYVPGGIPAGIGIPYSEIRSVPEGDYYAVVFFKDLIGCPSNNYQINSFVPGVSWGHDKVGGAFTSNQAESTTRGGCMQPFHVNPTKGNEWRWGAISNTGTLEAIGDSNDVPAFAICGTKAACEAISPRLIGDIPENTPTTTSTTTRKISNVLFLPGIKGSNLYEANPICIFGSSLCDISRWIPLADLFVDKLFLDSHGKSIASIYAKEDGILKKAFGYSFYDSFAQMMDSAQENGVFGSGWKWKSIAYDWRLSLPDLLSGGVHRGNRLYYGEQTEISYIESSLRNLASTSPTGKVTIFAHSNGGLVAKVLLQKLGATDAANLVDTLVLVGVPQSGSPRALGSLLYGEGENLPTTGLLKNVIMSAEHAREFALNAPMAYHLLPSAIYLAAQNISYPLVRFGESALFATERSAYGETINSAQELHNYALSIEGGRTMPQSSDLHSANILNTELLSYAETMHSLLDQRTPPPGIEVYQVGGYGVPTISGIEMYESPASTTSYRPLFTLDGDAAVPITSSLMMFEGEHVHNQWVDLGNPLSSGYSHGNLFEMPYVQTVLSNVLRGTQPSLVAAASARSPQHRAQLAFFLQGSGSLFLTDSEGRRTGISQDDETQIGIPGSTNGTFGDVTYVVVPAAIYTVQITSENTSKLTFDMQDLVDDEITTTSTIADIPFTSSTVVSFTIFESTRASSDIEIDRDGDGSTDLTITPKSGSVAFPTTTDTITNTSGVSSSKTSSTNQKNMSNVKVSSSLTLATTSSLTTSLSTTTPSIAKNTNIQIDMSAPATSLSTSTPALQSLKESVAVSTSTPENHSLSLWQRIRAFVRSVLDRILSDLR